MVLAGRRHAAGRCGRPASTSSASPRWSRFLENTSGYRRAFREREYGSLTTTASSSTQASPITYLDDIVAPLFVIHGANDPRVPLSEAEQIKAALDGKGVACELRVYHDEGHGLAKRANRLDAYPAALEFLAQHLSRPAG